MENTQPAVPTGASPIPTQQQSAAPAGASTSPYTPPQPPKSRKKLLLMIVILLVIGTLAGAYFLRSKIQKPQQTAIQSKESREGKFIIVNFGRYNPSPFTFTPIEATGSPSREDLLREERAYADELVKSVYSDLKSGNLTFDAAIEKVNNDPKVGTNSPYSSAARSGSFSSEDYLQKEGVLTFEIVKNKVDSLAAGEFSEPLVQQVNVSRCQPEDSDCRPTFADDRWIIIKVEKINK